MAMVTRNYNYVIETTIAYLRQAQRQKEVVIKLLRSSCRAFSNRCAFDRYSLQFGGGFYYFQFKWLHQGYGSFFSDMYIFFVLK